MVHKIGVNKTESLPIDPREMYSTHKVQVKKGERYLVQCDLDQRWKDWYVSTTVEGFFNPLASLLGLRVKKANCFCLCGAYNDSEEKLFRIGASRIITVTEDGTMCFFANDNLSKVAYSNNRGGITIQVTRQA